MAEIPIDSADAVTIQRPPTPAITSAEDPTLGGPTAVTSSGATSRLANDIATLKAKLPQDDADYDVARHTTAADDATHVHVIPEAAAHGLATSGDSYADQAVNYDPAMSGTDEALDPSAESEVPQSPKEVEMRAAAAAEHARREAAGDAMGFGDKIKSVLKEGSEILAADWEATKTDIADGPTDVKYGKMTDKLII